MEYLTDSPVAPLQRELVEVDDPMCCDIDVILLENKSTVFGITLQGVPNDMIKLTEQKLVTTHPVYMCYVLIWCCYFSC